MFMMCKVRITRDVVKRMSKSLLLTGTARFN